MKKIIKKVAEKVAYERESYRLSSEELARVEREHPELFRKGKK